jgi:CheY-like chemotaxis protein
VNVMVAQSMLMKLGHTLEVANNGADAIQALQQNSYDLILMDVCMPVMDGLEATRRIRRYEETGSWLDADEEVKRKVGGDSGGFLPDARFADAVPPQNVPRRRTPIIAVCLLLLNSLVFWLLEGTNS